jgi:hypothetical protein
MWGSASYALSGVRPHREPRSCGSHTVEGGLQWSKPASGTGEERGGGGLLEHSWGGVDLLGEQPHVHMRELVWSAGEEGGLMSCIGALWSSVPLCFGGCLLMVGVLWHWDLGVEGAGLGHGDWTVGHLLHPGCAPVGMGRSSEGWGTVRAVSFFVRKPHSGGS